MLLTVIYPKSSKILNIHSQPNVVNIIDILNSVKITLYLYNFVEKNNRKNNIIYESMVATKLIEKTSDANSENFSLSFLYLAPSRTAYVLILILLTK